MANPGVSQFANAAQAENELPVIQHQRRDFETVYRYIDPQNPDKLATMDEGLVEQSQEQVRTARHGRTRCGRAETPGLQAGGRLPWVVVEEDVTLPGKNFSLLCITGRWDPGERSGMASKCPMMDSQMMLNKSVSSALTFYITNAGRRHAYSATSFCRSELCQGAVGEAGRLA